MISTRTPTPEDINRVHALMRPMDQFECVSMGFFPYEALKLSIRQSRYVKAGLYNGEAEAIWGLAAVNELWSSYKPWMMMTHWPESHPKLFMKLSHEFVDEMKGIANYMQNYVHCRNDFSKRWLIKVGFEVSEQITVINSQPWNTFKWEKPNVHERTETTATATSAPGAARTTDTSD